MVKLQRALRDVRHEVAALAAWWLHEMRDLRAALVDRFAPQRSRYVVVELDRTGGTVRLVPNTDSTLHRFEWPAGSMLPPLEQIWPKGAPRGVRAVVILASSDVLVCPLKVPKVADRDLGRLIELQLERQLPLPRSEVYVDWQVSGAKADAVRTLEVAVARRARIDAVRDAIKGWGWRVTRIGREVGGRDLNLLPRRADRLNLHMGKREWLLAGSATGLLCVFVGTVAIQWLHERNALAASLASARTEVGALRALEHDIDAREAPLRALGQVMKTPSVTEALSALTDAMPADSWVYQSDVATPVGAPATLRFEAYTPTATTLVGQLESTPQLEQVQLVNATAVGVGVTSDRVQLTARLARGER